MKCAFWGTNEERNKVTQELGYIFFLNILLKQKYEIVFDESSSTMAEDQEPLVALCFGDCSDCVRLKQTQNL